MPGLAFGLRASVSPDDAGDGVAELGADDGFVVCAAILEHVVQQGGDGLVFVAAVGEDQAGHAQRMVDVGGAGTLPHLRRVGDARNRRPGRIDRSESRHAGIVTIAAGRGKGRLYPTHPEPAPAGVSVVRRSIVAATLGWRADGGAGCRPDPDLVALFGEWRAFQKPKRLDGVPDYTAAAMAAQQRELAGYQRRLAAIDPRGWPVPQQVDCHIVRAEMNGLDFDHRVLQAVGEQPGLLRDRLPRRERPAGARGAATPSAAVELWTYTFPLHAQAAARARRRRSARFRRCSQQARAQSGRATGSDLWTFGTQAVQAAERRPRRARREASGDAAGGLDGRRRSAPGRDRRASRRGSTRRRRRRPGPSGVGVENYDWYLKNVQLVPYTWRTRSRSWSASSRARMRSLALEEQRNAELPPQVPDRERRRARPPLRRRRSREYMAFLKDHDILTVRDVHGARAARPHRHLRRPARASSSPRWTTATPRSCARTATTGSTWRGWRTTRTPSPDPPGALLYNIFNTRTEGHATGWEELMLQAGMFDARPRSRELDLHPAGRARGARARAICGCTRTSARSSRRRSSRRRTRRAAGCSLTGATVRGEQHLYLQQPAYGTSYVIGKIEIEKLLGRAPAAARRAFR